MGTNIRVELWADSAELGDEAVLAVMAEMERINQLMNPYLESSELSLLNRQAARSATVVSQESFDLIATSVEL